MMVARIGPHSNFWGSPLADTGEKLCVVRCGERVVTLSARRCTCAILVTDDARHFSLHEPLCQLHEFPLMFIHEILGEEGA